MVDGDVHTPTVRFPYATGFLPLVLLVLTLAACQTKGGGSHAAGDVSAAGEPLSADEERERARGLLEEGRAEEALTVLALADSLAPGDEETIALRARVEADTGNLEEGISLLEGARLQHPRSKEIGSALHDLLVAGARADFENENYPAAWERLNEAGELEPDTPEVYYLRGMVAYSLARSGPAEENAAHVEESVRSFRAVLEHDPDDDDARFNLGASLLAAGRAREAAETYEELIERRPTDGRLYLALSRAHSLEGNVEAAVVEEAIGRALRSDRPVEDPALWASRAAERFPDSDLSATYLERGSPDAIYTYTLPGGVLVEVWFYGEGAFVAAFQDGTHVGTPYRAGAGEEDRQD
jgi:tetratricopeptide (TPR) repeat protein